MATRKSSKVQAHFGKVLMHLAKVTYTNLVRVVVECVQNAIDANAKNIWIAVDVNDRTIVVADNGDGVTEELFERALLSIGSGVKAADKIGRFGLGLISPLDKCEYFTFTSQPKSGGSRLCWEFRARDIEPQADEVHVPRREVAAPEGAEWTSVMRIHNYTKDREKSLLEPELIAQGVQEKLGPFLRKHGVTCHLRFRYADGREHIEDIAPLDYSGDPYPVTVYEEDEAGTVEFELYRAVKTSRGRNGVVSVSELDSPYPVTWREFVVGNRDLFSEEVRDVFDDGFFEGVIRCKAVELHPNRHSFVRNDALVGLCSAIERWWQEVGKPLYSEDRLEEQERHYQELGKLTLEKLQGLLQRREFTHMRNALQRIPFGTQGRGHAPVGEDTGEKTPPAVRPVSKGGSGSRGGTRKGRETRPSDVPLTVTGPDGKQREIVLSDSGGLQFVHSPLEGSDRLWELDDVHGIVYFNIRHPLWVDCDKKDSHILQLQEWIALQALSLLLQPAELRESLRDFVDNQAKPYVHLRILEGSKRTRRRT